MEKYDSMARVENEPLFDVKEWEWTTLERAGEVCRKLMLLRKKKENCFRAILKSKAEELRIFSLPARYLDIGLYQLEKMIASEGLRFDSVSRDNKFSYAGFSQDKEKAMTSAARRGGFMNFYKDKVEEKYPELIQE